MSKLRVNDVIPANGLNIGIGTAGGNFIVGGASTTVVVNGSVNATGTISASTFIGDGSGITGVTASGSGINIKDNSSIVGVAATIDFSTNLNVSPASAGIVTVTVGDSDFAIVDKIIHTGDTDTAIRFPSDDTVTVETGGSERLRITGIGSVGIATDNPDHAFHLYSGTLGIGKSAVTGFEITLDNNNLTFSRDSKSYINQKGTGTISVRLGPSYTEVAEFTSDGLKLPSGNGIDFSATADGSGTTSSELLDDYEEGTFTPEFANAASGGTESSSYAEQDGRYTKIGNLVHIDIYLKNVVTTSLGTSQFFIRGLPFAIKSGSIYIGQVGLSDVDLNSTASSLYSFANATNSALTAIRVFQTKDNTGHSAVPCDAVNSGDNEIFVTMTYPTDS